MGGLTAKQQTFVREYLVDLNATQAAIRAGYSAHTANEQGARLLAKASVAAAVQAGMDERAERTGITSDYVLTSIVETIERCKQASPVTYKNGDPVFTETPSGDVVPAYAFDSSAVLKGCELLGKHLKLFTDNVHHSGKVRFEKIVREVVRTP